MFMIKLLRMDIILLTELSEHFILRSTVLLQQPFHLWQFGWILDRVNVANQRRILGCLIVGPLHFRLGIFVCRVIRTSRVSSLISVGAGWITFSRAKYCSNKVNVLHSTDLGATSLTSVAGPFPTPPSPIGAALASGNPV
jgi:hypothetical protein